MMRSLSLSLSLCIILTSCKATQDNIPKPAVALGSTASTTEDTPFLGSFSISEDGGIPSSYIIEIGPRNGTVVITDSTKGLFTYTPKPDFNGTDKFTFLARNQYGDSNSAQVTITVQPGNDPPTATNANLVTNEDTPISGIFAASDIDSTGLTYSIVTNGSKGSAVVTNASTGAFTYSPDFNKNGIDTISFKVNDGNLDSNVAMITITINPVNDAPIAMNGTLITDEDVPKSGQLNGVDVDSTNLTFSIVTNGTKGVAVISNSSTGAFTYSPTLNVNGTDTFSFKVSDGQLFSNVATITITINPVNDAPIATSSTFTTLEDTPLSTNVFASDVDGPALTYSKQSEPLKGTVTSFNVLNGAFTYVPNANVNGSDSFTFRVNDGTLNSNVATVTINITPVDDPGVAENGSFTTDEDVPFSGKLVATDIDSPTLTYSIVSNGTKGAAVVTNSATGAFTYTPKPDANGSDSFTFGATGSTASSNVATMAVTINPVNDAPIAIGGGVSTAPLTPISGQLVATDIDSLVLSYAIVSNPTKGTVTTNVSGFYTYTPNAGVMSGTDSFAFSATDGVFSSNAASISVSIVHTPWVKQLGGSSDDFAKSVTVDSAGYSYLAGYTSGSFEDEINKGGNDAFITKVNPSGKIIWNKQLGGSSDDFANSVAVDSAGNSYLAGYTSGSFEGEINKGVGDAFITKLDSSGNFIWKKQLGGSSDDLANSVAVDSAGNSYLAGYTSGSFEGEISKGKADAFVIKLNSSGNIIWKKQLGGSSDDLANSVAVDSAGNSYLAGYTSGSFEGEISKVGYDAFITKLDSSGNIIWKKQLGGSSDDFANSVAAVDSAGNSYLAGYTSGSFEGEISKVGYDAFITKLDSSGNIIWKKQLGGFLEDVANSVTLDIAGNSYLAGHTADSFFEGELDGKGRTDAFIIKLNSSGNIIWKQRLGGSLDDVANSVAVDSAGNSYLVGYTSGSFKGGINKGQNDAFVTKIIPSPSPSPTPTATPTPNTCSHILFATNVRYASNFGSLSVADQACANAVVGIPALAGKSWKAIISNSTTNAKDRVAVSGKVCNSSSEELFANGSGMWSANPVNQIRDQLGNTVNAYAWTGTDVGGTKSSFGYHCSNWSVSTFTSTLRGNAGCPASLMGNEWLLCDVPRCETAQQYSFYCISQ